jgi:hypothetical protein
LLEAQRRTGERALDEREVQELAGAHSDAPLEPMSGEVEF